jgi:hypothetical protein
MKKILIITLVIWCVFFMYSCSKPNLKYKVGDIVKISGFPKTDMFIYESNGCGCGTNSYILRYQDKNGVIQKLTVDEKEIITSPTYNSDNNIIYKSENEIISGYIIRN